VYIAWLASSKTCNLGSNASARLKNGDDFFSDAKLKCYAIWFRPGSAAHGEKKARPNGKNPFSVYLSEVAYTR